MTRTTQYFKKKMEVESCPFIVKNYTIEENTSKNKTEPGFDHLKNKALGFNIEKSDRVNVTFIEARKNYL